MLPLGFAFGFVFGIAVTEGADALPSSLSSSSEKGASPFITRFISSPVNVSYSSKPAASRSHSFFFLVRILKAVS